MLSTRSSAAIGSSTPDAMSAGSLAGETLRLSTAHAASCCTCGASCSCSIEMITGSPAASTIFSE